ncbi:DinB family protein [Aeromicrobium sp. A1-2]|uniref:DinB family protein n=1 Tax=Aeromicrobium sp. A1-2 TaxID=2107713 RepID=UPI001C1F7838|nr:DinB family protein [Aeromicrobium sp. A1-2]
MNIEPDSKDWTWVLDATCPECGLVAADVPPGEIAGRVRESLPRWSGVLSRADARVRPHPSTWSPAEYAGHVRDVHALFVERTQLMLDRDAPQFSDWDQSAQRRLAVRRGHARAVLPARRRRLT